MTFLKSFGAACVAVAAWMLLPFDLHLQAQPREVAGSKVTQGTGQGNQGQANEQGEQQNGQAGQQGEQQNGQAGQQGEQQNGQAGQQGAQSNAQARNRLAD